MLPHLKEIIIGPPKDLKDKSLFHKLSLIPLLAWIGLGADGLSSSSYRPEEAYKIIGSHPYLALFLGIATAFTVFIISYAYSRIIEHFPHGGGGYVVASYTIGEKAGVISGAALLVDYTLTISVSLASCGDSIFSYLPIQFHKYKLFFYLFPCIRAYYYKFEGCQRIYCHPYPHFYPFCHYPCFIDWIWNSPSFRRHLIHCRGGKEGHGKGFRHNRWYRSYCYIS